MVTMYDPYQHGDQESTAMSSNYPQHGDQESTAMSSNYPQHGDQESTAMSSNYPQSWATSSQPVSPVSVLPPSESAIQLNKMYLAAKTEMLEVIEEGLQLKLEIQGIKDQFLNLIQDFDHFEQNDKQSSMTYPVNMLQSGAGMADMVKVSSARMRVRALYAFRKARIRARRAASAGEMETESSGLAPPLKMLKIDNNSDKENFHTPHRTSPNDNTPIVTSTPMAHSSQVPLRAMTWSVRRFLTPIKEEYHDQIPNCLPRNFHSSKSKSKNSLSRSPHTGDMSMDMGDYVSLRCTNRDMGEYVTLSPDSKKPHKHHTKRTSRDSRPQPVSACAMNKKGSKQVSVDPPCKPRTRPQSTGDIVYDPHLHLSPMAFTLVTSPLPEQHQSPRSDVSPIQSATSYTISELYTSNALKDMSLISKENTHEQVSNANLSGAFHSTFDYPLHSTLNYPLHSTFSLSAGIVTNCVLDEGNTGSNSDTRTTVSEPSTVITRRSSHGHHPPRHRVPKQSPVDSYIEYPSQDSDPSSISLPQARLFSPTSYTTPTKKPPAQLCKEHGIHPTFDGSCIFRSDNSNMNSTDEELDRDENGNTPKTKMSINETDCDSSYLSECVDDQHLSIDVDEYIATYDARNACIRMLKRQTGQTELKEIKDPVGLSESDLLCDVTRKQLSLEATRASLPDLSGLSTLPASDDDQSESTLHASSPRKSRAGSVFHESDDVLSPNDTLVSVAKRPLSLSTNDDSPESNSGLPVPVNSPNITDSGGSSSRQNTDNYMEMLPEETSIDVDQISLPASHTTHSSRSHHSHRASSSRSHHSHHSSKPHSTEHHHRSRHQYSSTPAQISDARSTRTTKSRSSHDTHSSKTTKPYPSYDTQSTRPAKSKKSRDSRSTRTGRALVCYGSRSARSPSTVPSHDWDSGCSSHDDRPQSSHFTISDNTGRRRTIVQHPPVSQNLPQERKKALVKKLKHFSNSFYKATSTGNLQIETLGHF